MKLTKSMAAMLPILFPMLAQATSFGALTNFDAVNDTGSPSNGFEIELDDITSKDVTFTFNYQRYGSPKIVEDHSDPAHPNKVFVRWMSPYDQVNHVFTATTPMAAAGFKDTGGHACLLGANPNGVPYAQAGCEHFGVGTLRNPTSTFYRWMKEDPASPGSLIAQGNSISIPAPAWTVAMGAGGVVNVKAVIPVPPPPPPALVPVPFQPNAEFGVAVWAKVMETESANPGKLDNLVSDDPSVPGNKGPVQPPNTVTEFEWQILQTDTQNPTANELAIDKPLGAGNENVTRRYEFYKYVGPYDLYDADTLPGTNEALCPSVGADGVHGSAGVVSTYNRAGQPLSYDCAQTVVVGAYIGAQMAGADVALPLSANGANLPDGEVGVKYPDRPLILGGSGGPYSVSFVSGSLPQPLPGQDFTLDSLTGVLNGGTPSGTGTATFTVNGTDLVDPAQKPVTATFTINVVDAVQVDGVAIPNGAANISTTVLLTASGGESPFKWTAVPATPGLSASLTGGNNLVLRAAANGAYSVQVSVTDSLGGTATRTLTYTVGAAIKPVTITTNALPNGQANQAYAAAVAGSGGTGALNFTAAGLPAGLSMAANGTVSGTPTAFGTFMVAVTATDPAGAAGAAGASTTKTLSLTIAPPPVAITTTALPGGQVNQAYAATVAGTGGTGSLNFTAAGLPAGLSMAANGAVSGTPTSFGTFTVTVTATDPAGAAGAVGVADSKTLSLTIAPPPVAITTTALPSGLVNLAYAATVAGTGGTGTLSFTASGLPTGLAMAANGAISGTPTAFGTFTVAVTATDPAGAAGAAGASSTKNLSLAISAGNYTVPDESQGKITALGTGYLTVGGKRLIWNVGTKITVNTPDGEIHTVNNFVKVGMKAQWKGLRDKATNTVLTGQLEIN